MGIEKFALRAAGYRAGTDRHTSDVGRWLAMTELMEMQRGRGRTLPLRRDKECGAWLDGAMRVSSHTQKFLC